MSDKLIFWPRLLPGNYFFLANSPFISNIKLLFHFVNFQTMDYSKRHCYEDVTVLSNWDRVLRDGRQAAAECITAISVRNPWNTPYSGADTVRKVVAPIRSEEVENTSEIFTERSFWKNALPWEIGRCSTFCRPSLRIPYTKKSG